MPRHPVLAGTCLDGGDDLVSDALVDIVAGRGLAVAIGGHGVAPVLALSVEGEATGADAVSRTVTPCSRSLVRNRVDGPAASATTEPLPRRASTGDVGHDRWPQDRPAVRMLRGSQPAPSRDERRSGTTLAS